MGKNEICLLHLMQNHSPLEFCQELRSIGPCSTHSDLAIDKTWPGLRESFLGWRLILALI